MSPDASPRPPHAPLPLPGRPDGESRSGRSIAGVDVPVPLVVVLAGVVLCGLVGLVVIGMGAPVRRPVAVGPTVHAVPSPVAPSEGVSIPATTPPPGPTATDVARGASAVADLTAPPNVDSSGGRVTYDAQNVLDGDPATAWRATGDARGRTLQVRLTAPRTLTAVGIVNGYAKRDPATRSDRYTEERRITSVTWIFDDGTWVTQPLDDGVRTPQRLEFDPVRTSAVTLRIDATTPPGDPDRDYTAIGEVELFGV